MTNNSLRHFMMNNYLLRDYIMNNLLRHFVRSNITELMQSSHRKSRLVQRKL